MRFSPRHNPVAALKGQEDQKGAVMIEASLVVGFMTIILLGIIQYGMILATYVSLRNATAVGARYATLYNPGTIGSTQVQNAVNAAVGPYINTANLTVSFNGAYGSPPSKQVQVSYPLPLFFPIVVPQASGGNLTITAVTIMR